MGTLIAWLVAIGGFGMVGLAIRQGRSKGAPAALQMAAFGFLLIGASATGLVKLVTTLVFNPLAWIGVGTLSLAAVLFVVGQKLEGPSDKPKKTKKVEESSGKKKPAVEPAPKRKDKTKAKGDDEFDDIESILRKHGIE